MINRSIPATLICIAGLLLTTGFTGDSGRHALSPEQLEWQGYHEGEVLRFGSASSPYVRTYLVKSIKIQFKGDGAGLFNTFQTLTAFMQRTDSLREPFQGVVLELRSGWYGGEKPAWKRIARDTVMKSKKSGN